MEKIASKINTAEWALTGANDGALKRLKGIIKTYEKVFKTFYCDIVTRDYFAVKSHSLSHNNPRKIFDLWDPLDKQMQSGIGEKEAGYMVVEKK